MKKILLLVSILFLFPVFALAQFPPPTDWINPPDRVFLSVTNIVDGGEFYRIFAENICQFHPTARGINFRKRYENFGGSNQVTWVDTHQPFRSCENPYFPNLINDAHSIVIWKNELTQNRYFANHIGWYDQDWVVRPEIYKIVVRYDFDSHTFTDLSIFSPPPLPSPSDWLNPASATNLSFVTASETSDSVIFQHQPFCHLQPTLDSFHGLVHSENLDNTQKQTISTFTTLPNRLSCGAIIENNFSIPKAQLTQDRYFSRLINWQTANELPFSDLTWDYKFVVEFNKETAGFYDLQGNRLYPTAFQPPLTLLPPVVPEIGFLPLWLVEPAQNAINQVQEIFKDYLETIKTRFPISWFYSVQEIINNARNVPGQKQYPSLVFAVPDYDFQVNMLPIQNIVNSPNLLNSGVSFTPIVSLFRLTLQFMLFVGFAFVVVNRVRAFIYSLSIPA